MFEVVKIALATTERFFELKLKYPEIKGFGLKAFDHAWMLDVHRWAEGERVLEVGGAYSWLPARLRDDFGCEMWVADDFGVTVDDPFWLRQRSPQEFVDQRPDVKYVLERVGDPAKSSLPEDYFDVVYSVSTLEHVPNRMMPDVWRHMARLVRPGGELIHAIDMPFPSNGGLKRLLKSAALDAFALLLPASVRLKYLKATPKNYVSFVLRTLDIPARSFPELNVLRMSLDPEVVTESYQHKLNRITKDHTDSRYQRFGSLLVHLRHKSAAIAAGHPKTVPMRTESP